ncbi:MAG: manganese efflux pump [Anaerolineaceae bacterium]|nr:manganese efflux pump [Anaerolineaceae bacterium]
MAFFSTLLISIGLAMDCFAVSLCAATIEVEQNLRYKFRIAWHFGLFQAGFALIGYFFGSKIAHFIESWDHWLAFGLLLWIAIKMIREGLNPNPESCPSDPSRGKMLILFSIATSIDAMAVGLGIGLVGAEIVSTSIMIGVTSFLFSILGMYVGKKLGFVFGKRMEIFGGAVLAFIGINILIEHAALPALLHSISALF